jgi:Nickel responsive protein SCO4226-like
MSQRPRGRSVVRHRSTTKEDRMQLYTILRRSGWRSPAELQEAAVRSKQVADDQMPDDIRWIRSYVLDEGAGTVGTVCIYQATSPEAIRRHASLADLPITEIIPVADTVIVRADPEPAVAG